MPNPDFNLAEANVAIVGLGLMGGSLALGLKGKCAALYGIDPHRATLELALSRGVVDRGESDPAKLFPDADLIILATPIPAILTLLEQLSSYTGKNCVVMDMGSTKQLIVDAMSRLPGNFDPIGGHPICGKEKTGLENAEIDLYRNTPFVITALERTTSRARSAAGQVVSSVGANIVEMDAGEHDRVLAHTSHLPFLLSSTLALATPLEFGPLTGPGFRSTSRLAGTPTHIMVGILKSNRENTLAALQSLQRQLSEFEALLDAEKFPELESVLDEARDRYQTFVHPSSLSRQISPIPDPLRAVVRVPGSKSLTNRALLIASLAKGTTRIANALFSDDSRRFAEALQTLGFDIKLDEANCEMNVAGLGGSIPAASAKLYVGNAGTAARFLSAFLTLGSGEYILDGDSRMRERPIGDLVDAMKQLGCDIKPAGRMDDSRRQPPAISHGQICPPLKIAAKGVPGGKTTIAGDVSSQFLSALLMVAPYARSPVEITLSSELNSKPYVDMTIAVMKDFGVDVQRDGWNKFTVHPSFFLPPGGTARGEPASYFIESDASAASYFFAAPAICGGAVCVENISRRSVQGDIGFLDVLEKMGCTVSEADNFISVTGSSFLCGVDMDMRDIPDTAQTLAAIAPFASSPTRIRGIASARVKETDRVQATCTELRRLGVQVEEYEDGMTIHPCKTFKPASVRTYNDHRMAMAFSLIGLRVPGIAIENPDCVSKTFPNFFDVLEALR